MYDGNGISDMDTIMRRQGKFHNLLSQDSCPENIYDTGLLFYIFRDIFYQYASNLCKKK